MRKTIVSTAVTCLLAGVAFTALDAAAAIAPATVVAPSGAVSVIHSDTTPILVARQGADNPPGDVRGGHGADNPPGDMRRGRGADNAVSPSRRGADNPATDQRRGRGADDATPGGRGADNPPGDLRRGRGRDDPLNHG
jgi:hypothetical protein